MSKTNRALCFALLLALAFGLVEWLAAPPPDPSYQGVPEHVWLQKIQRWNGDTNELAFKAFQALGSNALPQLLIAAQRKPSSLARLVNFINRKQSYIKLPRRNEWNPSLSVMWAFYAVGTNALPAQSQLTDMLFSPHRPPGPFASAIGLAGLGNKGVPILLEALTNQDPDIRQGAIVGLGWERENASAIIPPLIICLHDGNPAILRDAISSLGMLHAEPEIVVPALIETYSNSDVNVVFILSALSQYGTNAQAAIPLIQAATHNTDPGISNLAASILNIVTSTSPPTN